MVTLIPSKYKRIIMITIEYILALFIILDCNSVYTNLVNSPFNLQKMSLVLSAILIAVICWCYEMNWLEALKSIIYPAALVAVISMILFAFLKFPNGLRGSYIKFFVLFLPISIMLFKLYRNLDMDNQLFFRISDILVLLSVLSLTLWLLGPILGIIQPNKVVQSLWEPMTEINSYWGLQFLRPEQREYIKFLDISVYRNIGLYPESPMFNIVLLLGFCTELFLRSKVKLWRLLLFSITILTTFGSLAIMLASFAVFLKFCVGIGSKRRWIIYIMAVCLIAIVIILLIYKKKYNIGSYNTHLDDLIACIKAWYTSPIFGTGFENNNVVQYYMAEFRKVNKGYTTSAGAVLAHGGLTLFSIYIIPFKSLLSLKNKNANINIFGIIFLTIIVTYIFTYRFMMFWILAYGYSKIELKYITSKERI